MGAELESETPVRVRIAPSPTGAMHIGSVRTALYNWLFARRHGGSFILRIDDTDTQRNQPETLEPIFRSLRWLGIDWDEGPLVGGPHEPYYQSGRTRFHRAAVEQLLASGYAYHDYATPDEIEAERRATIDGKQGVFRYSRRWMAETESERARFEAQGRKAVVRLKMPTEGVLVVDDLIRGPVRFEWAREQDHVIQRADGTVLYHLASIVDDRDMAISHVIRAEEHLSNTARQVFILQALGAPLPRFAHLPFVAEPGSRNKLSKRRLAQYLKQKAFAELMARGTKVVRALGITAEPELFNPVVVGFYERIGFLPEALLNYVALLGWALDDKTEELEREELIRAFSLERVIRSPASFDADKLLSFQVRRMLATPVLDRARLCLGFVVQAGLASDTADTLATIARIVAAAGDRIKVACDILDYADFFVPDEQLVRDESALRRELGKPEAANLVRRFRDRLALVASFDAPALEQLLQEFVAAEGIKVGQVIHALRVAVTGKPVGFGMFDTLAILGRERCLRRIDLALAAGRE